MINIGLFGDNEYSLDLLGKEYSLEYWILILNKFGKRIFFRFIGKRIFFRILVIILNKFGKRIFFRLLDSYFEKIWEKNIL